MRRQKTLFDLFRDNAHKLNEAPSRQTWQRLEERLEKRRRRSLQLRIRHMAIAAAISGIAILAVLAAMLADNRQHNNTVYQIESLDQRDVNEEALEAIAFSRRISLDKPAAIAEGQAGQRLVPRGM